MMDTCIFCKIVSGDLPSTTVREDDDIVAFEDINPVTPTHVLVVPKEHTTFLRDLRPEQAALLGRMAAVAEGIATERGIQESGHRLVINQGPDAGQQVDHLHLHLLGGRPMGAMG